MCTSWPRASDGAHLAYPSRKAESFQKGRIASPACLSNHGDERRRAVARILLGRHIGCAVTSYLRRRRCCSCCCLCCCLRPTFACAWISAVLVFRLVHTTCGPGTALPDAPSERCAGAGSHFCQLSILGCQRGLGPGRLLRSQERLFESESGRHSILLRWLSCMHCTRHSQPPLSCKRYFNTCASACHFAQQAGIW